MGRLPRRPSPDSIGTPGAKQKPTFRPSSSSGRSGILRSTAQILQPDSGGTRQGDLRRSLRRVPRCDAAGRQSRIAVDGSFLQDPLGQSPRQRPARDDSRDHAAWCRGERGRPSNQPLAGLPLPGGGDGGERRGARHRRRSPARPTGLQRERLRVPSTAELSRSLLASSYSCRVSKKSDGIPSVSGPRG